MRPEDRLITFTNCLTGLAHFYGKKKRIETDNPQSEDVNSTKLNITCCHLGINCAFAVNMDVNQRQFWSPAA